MTNYLWVVEYNMAPRKLKESWSPILIHPEWNRDGARKAAKDRAKETGLSSRHYRVRKYISV